MNDIIITAIAGGAALLCAALWLAGRGRASIRGGQCQHCRYRWGCLDGGPSETCGG